MANPLLHIDAVVLCSHGARLSFRVTNPRVLVDGKAVVTEGDSNGVSGCSFQIPYGVGTKPQPCDRVHWSQAARRVHVGGKAVLLSSSAGTCMSSEGITQGAPSAAQVQLRVTGN